MQQRKPGQAVVIHPDQRKGRTIPGNPLTYQELSPEGIPSMGMFLATAPAGTNTGAKALQHGGDETMLVLSGRFELEVEDLKYNLEPDDSVFIPRGAKHRLATPAGEKGQVVFVLSPPQY